MIKNKSFIGEKRIIVDVLSHNLTREYQSKGEPFNVLPRFIEVVNGSCIDIVFIINDGEPEIVRSHTVLLIDCDFSPYFNQDEYMFYLKKATEREDCRCSWCKNITVSLIYPKDD